MQGQGGRALSGGRGAYGRASRDPLRRRTQRPAVIGTGLDVWEIVEVAKDNGGSVEETAAYLEIDPRLVESGIRYYGANQEEIDDWTARETQLSEREEAKWRAAREAIST